MTYQIEMQSPVTREKSIRIQISNHSWKNCFANFFLENVPFSGRTNLVYANKLVNMYVSLLQENSLTPQNSQKFHVYEFGAGTGLLSKHFLDILKAEHPEIYQNTSLHVTDSSKNMIEKLKTISIFYDHIDQIKLEVIDAENFKSAENEKPIFAFSSYLLSSMPTKHLEIQNQEVKELLVKTLIDSNAVILDTTEYLPKTLTAAELAKPPKDFSAKKLNILAPKLIKHLKESYSQINLSDTEISSESLTLLNNTLNKLEIKANQTIRFNYSFDSIQHINNVLGELAQNGLYIVSDFGHTKLYAPQPELLNSSYGITTTSSVCFPFIQNSLENSIITNRENDLTQEIAFSNKAISQTTKTCFQSEFSNMGTENIAEVIHQVSKLEQSDNYISQAENIINKLSEQEKTDYIFLKTISFILLTNGYDKQAYEYALKLLNQYGELAIDAYSILGSICQTQGFLEEALECFNKILDIAPNNSVTYESISAIQLRSGKQEEAFNSLKQALFFSRDNMIWHLIIGLAAIEQDTGNQETAQKLLSWPVNISKQHSNLVSNEILEKFKDKTLKKA
jgi:SAM-dependent MidA family methyltransferase